MIDEKILAEQLLEQDTLSIVQTDDVNGKKKDSKMYLISKRIFDILMALLLLVISAIPMAIIAAIIKLQDPNGGVFFAQERYGLEGKRFKIYKFRSMVANAEEMLKNNEVLYKKYIENGYKLPEGEDPRIMNVGSILRKTSLDELPQIFNVLNGSMSFVGPRPILDEELKSEYGIDRIKFLSVKPGVTGYWQANGRSNINYPERAQMELYYISNRSFLFDLKIVYQTFLSVVSGKGAH